MVNYDRIRNRSSSSPVTWVNELGPSYEKTEVTCVETFSDMVIKEYHKRSALGEIFNNPMSSVREDTYSPVTKIYRTIDLHGRSGVWYDQLTATVAFDLHQFFIHPTLSLPSYDMTDLSDAASAVAWGRVGVDEAELLVSMAELNQTCNMLVMLGLRAARLFRDFKRKRLDLIKKRFTPENVRDLYLEFRYGMRPLYYDLKGLYSALAAKRKNDRRTSRSAREHKFVTSESELTKTSAMLGTSTSYYTTLHATSKQSARCSVNHGVLYTHEFEDNLSDYLSLLGVDRPISSLWETIPFSFMIDWFLGIGPLIRAWEPKPKCDVLASWSVQEIESVSEIEIISADSTMTNWGYPLYYTKNIYNYDIVGGAKSTSTVKQKTRIPNPDRPLLPTMDIRLNVLKLTDMVAIFWGLKQSNKTLRI